MVRIYATLLSSLSLFSLQPSLPFLLTRIVTLLSGIALRGENPNTRMYIGTCVDKDKFNSESCRIHSSLCILLSIPPFLPPFPLLPSIP